MTSIPLNWYFGIAGALTHRRRSEPARHDRPQPRSLFRRLVDAVERSRQRAADREIARVLGANLGAGDRLNDEMERRLLQYLTENRSFRP